MRAVVDLSRSELQNSVGAAVRRTHAFAIESPALCGQQPDEKSPLYGNHLWAGGGFYCSWQSGTATAL